MGEIVDGQVWQTAGGPQTLVAAQLTSFSTAGEVTAPLPVLYAGPAPTLVSGVQQVNLQISPNLPDYFVTQAIGPASSATLQVGPQQLNFPVYVQSESLRSARIVRPADGRDHVTEQRPPIASRLPEWPAM